MVSMGSGVRQPALPAAWQIALGTLLVAVCAATALVPFTRFVVTGWAAKRKDIMDGDAVA
jgi:hypothetical protein